MTRRKSFICDYCGSKENGEKYKKCLGCNGKAIYCSISCQKAAWRSHRRTCRQISNKMEILALDDSEMKDFDHILLYAQKYMTSINHCELRLADDHKGHGVSQEVLTSFLKSKRGQLETLYWCMDHSCVPCCSKKTNDGLVWKELHGLKVLRMTYPVFKHSQDLVAVIQQQ